MTPDKCPKCGAERMGCETYAHQSWTCRIRELEAENKRLREAFSYWSYCTWQGMLRWCPEKKEVLQELMAELSIEPYASKALEAK